jgi:hypothetical protein
LSSQSWKNWRFGNFSFAGLKIRVSSTQPEDLVWLREFLKPQFGGFRDRRPDCTVSLKYDIDRHASLLAAGPHPTLGEVDCFSLDRRIIRLPAWQSPDPGLLIFDGEFNVFYGISPEGRDISITAAAPSLWSGRISLMRVVRELAMNHAGAREGTILHAAAFLWNGRGVLIAGPKGAGKTSVLTYFLQQQTARFVANDRVLVQPARLRLRLRGIPTVVTLRKTTLEMFPAVRQRLEGSSFNPCLRLREARLALLGPAASDNEGRLHLSPRQLLATTGSGMAGGGPLSLLIFPRVTPQRTGASLVPLPAESAAERIGAALFQAGSVDKRPTMFVARRSRDAAPGNGAAHFARALASCVPCFECRLGRRAFHGDLLLRRVLTQLEEKG